MTRSADAVREEVVRLDIDGRLLLQWTASPRHLLPLALGRLSAEGFVSGRGDVVESRTTESAGVHRVAIVLDRQALERGLAERAHRDEAGCGILHFLDCDPDALRAPPRAAPDADAIAPLFRALFDAAAEASPGGGVHSAALSDGTSLLRSFHDIGRHNAVDKVVGDAILEDRDRAVLGLVLTARISADIALKAARARLAWVASRSVPTTLAVRIADVAGLPLLARAGSGRARVHGAAS